MPATEFRKALNELGVSPYRFAQIARIDKSTIYKWLRGDHIVPGYAVTILELLQENHRLRTKAERDIREAINKYSIESSQWT